MRLPWPFRRSPQSSTPGAAPTAPPVLQRQRAEWRDLPPLTETIAPPPLVAPNARFSAGLAVNNPPPPALARLGHQRSLDATPGLALGLARPVSRSVDGGATARPASRAVPGALRRWLQRRAATPSSAGEAWPEGEHIDEPAQPAAASAPATPTARPAAAAQRSAATPSDPTRAGSASISTSSPAPSASPASPTPGSVPAARSAPLPLARQVAAVPAADAVRPAPLTTAPANLLATPAPAATNPAIPLGSSADATPAVASSAPHPGRVLPFRPAAGAAGAAAVSAAPARAATPIVSRSTAAAAPRMTLAQSRRAGLGVPVGAQKDGTAPATPTTSAGTATAGAPPAPTAAGHTAAPVQRQAADQPASAAVAGPAPSADSATLGPSLPAGTPALSAARGTGVQRALATGPAAHTVKPLQRSRLGLGEPLDLATRPAGRPMPPTPTAQAEASVGAVQSAPGATAAPPDGQLVGTLSTQAAPLPTAARAASADEPADASGSAQADAGGHPPHDGRRQLPLTLRRTHGEGPAAPEDTVAAPVQRATGEDPSVASPAPAVTVARAIETPASRPLVRELIGTTPLIRRQVQRDAAATGPSTSPAAQLRRAASTATQAPTLTGSGGAHAPVAHALPTVQAEPAGAAGLPGTPPNLALTPRRGQSSSAAEGVAVGRSVQRASALPVPSVDLPLAPARGPSQASIEATAMAVAQRTIEARAAEEAVVMSAPPAPAPVQRAVMSDSISPTPSTPTPTSTTTAGALPHTPAELEQLATKLWGRLRLQLRRELLADRERAGMLTDMH